jgi:hypothetical protein
VVMNRQCVILTVKNEPKKPLVGHFEFPISTDRLLYAMSLHLAQILT